MYNIKINGMNKWYEIFIQLAMNNRTVMEKFALFYLTHNAGKPNVV